MNSGIGRRSFFKRAVAAATFGGGTVLSGKNAFAMHAAGSLLSHEQTGVFPMESSDYKIGRYKNRITIQYYGLSCFMVTSSTGKRIVMDPFIADRKILFPELAKEPADVVTISCGSYSHCHVFAVGGVPFVYQVTEPAELHGIKFRGVETEHLKMTDGAIVAAGKNVVVCFEVDGIKLCHLGALGHKLTDEQVNQIGPVDILMVPVGGVSTLPIEDARAVCKQINPQIIMPMHYRNERALFPEWATVYDFLSDRPMQTKNSDGQDKKYYQNTLLCDYIVGSNIFEFMKKDGRVELTCPGDKSQIAAASMNVLVPRCGY